MTRENAFYQRIKLLCGDWESYNEWLDTYLEIEDPLSDILIKLIDREAGETTFEVIRQLKGRFSAFLWQSVARLFGSSLKTEYDPGKDDALIEAIVLMIDDGML
jgi:hypothetical protein